MAIFNPQINASQSLEEFLGISLLCGVTWNVIGPDTKHQKIQSAEKAIFLAKFSETWPFN